MAIGGYEAYKYYVAITAHFTSESYDIFTKRGHTKTTLEKFQNRNDHKIFDAIGKDFTLPLDIVRFFVSNISINENQFLYNRERANSNYKKWIAYLEAISYKFMVDISEIEKYSIKNKTLFLESVWKCYLNKSINIQTIHIINEQSDIFSGLSEATKLIHHSDILRIKKCKGFVKIPNSVKSYYLNFKENWIQNYEATI
jgi:hypothetical protein